MSTKKNSGASRRQDSNALKFTKKQTSEIEFKGTIRPESRYMEIVRALKGAKPGEAIEVDVPKGVTPERMRSQIYQTLTRYRPEIADGLRCKTGITTDGKVAVSIVPDKKRGKKKPRVGPVLVSVKKPVRKAKTTKPKKAKAAKKKPAKRKPSGPKGSNMAPVEMPKPVTQNEASDLPAAAPTID